MGISPNAYGAPVSVGSYAAAIGYDENGSIETLAYGNGRVYTTTQRRVRPNCSQSLRNTSHCRPCSSIHAISEEMFWQPNREGRAALGRGVHGHCPIVRFGNLLHDVEA